MLPFETHVRLPAFPLTGPARVVLVPEVEDGDGDAQDFSGAGSLMALFVQAVNAQMFTRDGAEPAKCSVLSQQALGSTGACEFRMDVENVPISAWAHLLSMLRKNHDAFEPLHAALIETDSANAELPLQTVLDAVPQRLRDDDPGFAWSTAGAEKSRNIHLDLEFRCEVQPAIRAGVEQDLGVWLQLNILGAFDLRFDEAQDLDPLGTVQSTSAFRIECFVPYYTGDMSGMVSLENLVCDVHRRRQALEEATLE